MYRSYHPLPSMDASSGDTGAATGGLRGNSADTPTAVEAAYSAHRSGVAPAPNKQSTPHWMNMLQSALQEAKESQSQPALPEADTPPVKGGSVSGGAGGGASAASPPPVPQYTVVSTETRFTHPISGKEYTAVGHGSREAQAKERAWERSKAEMREVEGIARMGEQGRVVKGATAVPAGVGGGEAPPTSDAAGADAGGAP